MARPFVVQGVEPIPGFCLRFRVQSKACYVALRSRGHSHGRALRGVADRLLGLACVLLQKQTPFDPQYDHLQPKYGGAVP